ncbi:MAG: dephospho-CoA kinase [Ruminococcaceae bacterium]|nr:dephospho-CoA kinase [Oscillospiraceae bacterium]
MKVIGLTGPSGAGKTLAAEIFAAFGVPTIDADAVYHDILARGDDCTKELAAAFGREILDKNGLVSRRALANTVFGKPDTPTLLHTLNTITHKYVMSDIKKMLSSMAAAGISAVLLDAPLLFEANAQTLCDVVIALLAPYSQRLSRIIERDGIDEAAAAKRLAAGKDDAFYRSRCGYILENDGNKAALTDKIKKLLMETGVVVV